VIEPERMAILQLASFLALALSWQLPAPSLGAERSFQPPLVGSELVNNYRQSEGPYGPGHRGVDYLTELGQGVFAPAAGEVHFVGKVVDRQLITLSHEGELLTSYEPVCSGLEVGQQVNLGELIGEVCEPEPNYQPHCEVVRCAHFSVRKNGEYLSPLWFTGELTRSRLLPWIEPES
jgi:murein DD-endopeptidase MepM/ murein hydrolase activator NlpD